MQSAETVTSDAAINTTNASNKAKEVEEPITQNKQPATTTPTAPPDAKHKRGAARSNTKAKRQHSKEIDAIQPQSSPARTRKKRFRWAMDIENSLGTGNQRSDARIQVSKSSRDAADASDSEDSSNESNTDPTPPIAMSSSRRSRDIDLHPVEPFNNVSGFSDTASDASSTASGTDIVAGQTHPFFYHGSKRYFSNDAASNMQREHEFAHYEGKKEEQGSTPGGVYGIHRKLKRHLRPIFIQTNRKEDITISQNTPRGASTRPEPELSYTSEDLRRLKRSDYDPVIVQAVGRGDFDIPLPKTRQKNTGSSENSPLERTYRKSRSDSGTTTSDADHQYKKVKHAISDAQSNAEWNKGLSPGRSGDASTRGERRCSLELAREKGKISRSSESQESKPEYSSRYQKPLFVYRPDNDDESRRPLIVFENQRDLDELRAQDRRSRKKRENSPPYPFDVVVPDTRDESRKKGASKTSRQSYRRPHVSDENDRSVHDDYRSYFHS